MRGKELYISALLFCPFISAGQQPDYYGQSLVPKLPEAEKFEVYGKISVNNSQGAPDISIPIYEISVDGVTVPVTINYISTGIRVNDIPTAVGLNWFINAGGYVSRNINGLADEEDLGWFNVPEEFRPETGWWNRADCDPGQLKFQAIANYQWDAVPDNFSYNFLGHNGSFFFGRDKSCHKGLNNELKIEFWDRKCITDKYGNRYFFGGSSESREINGISVFQEGDPYGTEGRNASGTTGWRLTKIITRNGREITFTYESYNYRFLYQSGDNYNWYKYLCDNMECISSAFIRMYISCNAYASLLKTISVDNDLKVEFLYEVDPELKVWQKKLTEIHIHEKTDDTPRIFKFSFDKYSDSRLQLTGIEEQSPVSRDRSRKYTFRYQGNPGSYASKSTDRFGYYNGSSGVTDIPDHIRWPDNPDTETNSFRDRKVNNYWITAGILEEIVYPTGGKTVFHYEANSEGDFYSPGVRVRKVEEFDGFTRTGARLYKYEGLSGYRRDNGNYEDHTRTLPHYFYLGEDLISFVYTAWYFLSSNEYHDRPGDSHDYFYRHVSVEELDRNDNPKIRTDEYFKPYLTGNSLTGQITRRDYFAGNQKDIIKREDFEYSYSRTDSIYGFVSEDSYFRMYDWSCDGVVMKPAASPVYYYPNLKPLIFRSNNLLQTRVMASEFIEGSDTIMNITDLKYNTCYQISETKEWIIGSSDTITCLYRYAGDYNIPGMKLLESKNIIGIPVDVRVLNKDLKVTQGRISELDSNGNIITIYNPDNTVPAVNNWSSGILVSVNFYQAATMTYDSKGNIKEIRKTSNIPASYIWGYNHSYPVIRAENIGISALESKIGQSLDGNFESLDDLLRVSSSFPGEAWNTFNRNLRKNAGENVMISTFTYKPLFGMTSRTDPNGVTVYYEYDDMGRLKCIKDDDGRIVTAWEYNYRR